MSHDIKCPCCTTKTVAKERDGKVFVWCKQCKQEVELIIEPVNTGCAEQEK